jgi:hypothetical protein
MNTQPADPIAWRFYGPSVPWVQRECARLAPGRFRMPTPAHRPPPVRPSFARGACLGAAFPAGSVLWFEPSSPVDGDVVMVDVGPVFRWVATAQARAGVEAWTDEAAAAFVLHAAARYRNREAPHRLAKLYREADGEAWLICLEGAFRAEPHTIIGRLTYAVVNGRSAYGGGPLPPDRHKREFAA